MEFFLISFTLLGCMLLTLLVAVETFFFVVYKTTGGKWSYFQYWKWFLNHF